MKEKEIGFRGKLYLKKMPEEGEFKRVHAVLVIDDGRILLRYKNGEARTTGGRIEVGDRSLEETLRRELREEINCEIDRCEYLGYLEAELSGARSGILGADGGTGLANWRAESRFGSRE